MASADKTEEILNRVFTDLQAISNENKKLIAEHKLLEEEVKAKTQEILSKEETHKEEIESLQTAVHTAEQEILSKEETHKEEIESLQTAVHTAEQEILSKEETHKEEIESLQTAVHIAEQEKWDLARALKQQKRENLFQQNDIKEKSENIECLQREKQELMNKLREMAAFKRLPMEVSSLCDLSDENRPTRLAEEYTALYNNEWKDIFATLSFTEKQRKADYILKLLKHADQLSRMSSERHRSSIKRSFTTITVGDNPDLQEEDDDAVPGRRPNVKLTADDSDSEDSDDAVPGRRLNVTTLNVTPTVDGSDSQADIIGYEEISFDFEKLATEHKCAVDAVRTVVMTEVATDFEKYASDIISETLTGDLKKNGSVKRFISKSVSLCWRMCRHDPPVYIKFQEITDNTVFDKNVYKPYKKSGQRVHFMVWPALYAHEGGPLLEKGIAEGRP